MRKLTKIALIVSFAWAIIFTVIFCLSVENVSTLKLNELGDFLGGFSAPLALFWLVIGYFQQGEELRLNTEALKAQQEELRRQVEETAFLAKNAERQAAASETIATLNERSHSIEQAQRIAESKPKFIANGGSTGEKIKSNILNTGAEIFDITAPWDNNISIDFPERIGRWKNNEEKILTINSNVRSQKFPFLLKIKYKNKFGNTFEAPLQFTGPHEFLEIGS